ncbi:MAG: hypothetical protein ABJO67_18185 [Pseudoruegeria sp.]
MFKKTPKTHKRVTQLGAGVSAYALSSGVALAAASNNRGIDKSFWDLQRDFATMIDGNFGTLILLISLIIGIGVYAVTSSWKWVISSIFVAFIIGYGVDIVSGVAGTTATLDMVMANASIPLEYLAPAAQ